MKHLTLDERIRIQEGLNQRFSIRKIAITVNKEPSTVMREIKNHRYYKGKCKEDLKPECARREICTIKGLCDNSRCVSYCKYCMSCYNRCDLYTPGECYKIKHSPYVCNGCSKFSSCNHERYVYLATYAQSCYSETLVSVREGINKEPEEIQNLDELISPLIKKGQTIAHVYNSHKDAMICSRSTLYKYINESVLTAKSVDLPRKVKYKIRKKKGPVRYSKATQLSVLTRNYERFKKHMEENPDTNVVEMDTVVGPVYSKKALLTLLFRSCNLMLAILLPEKTQENVIDALNELSDKLTIEVFKQLFPVILTDRGTEFLFPEALECDSNGELKTKIFYCDPQCSWQKGGLEKNHEFIRYIVPKGRSFDQFDQDDITLMINHINSVSRDKFNGATPYKLSVLLLNNKLHEVMELKEIEPDEVTLKPSLLKSN